MTEENSNSLFWTRVKLLSLVAVFLAPFIGGWLAFYVFELRPSAGNYGSLVQPARKIDWPPLEVSDGRRFEEGFGRKWTFVLFAGEGCDELCFSNLYYMRQIRTLLGRDTLRLQNLLVLGRQPDEKLEVYLRDFPNLLVVPGYRDSALYGQFEVDGEKDVGAAPKMYLVDPDQHLMMHYPAENDHNRVLEDIKKLMKLSQIG